MTAPRDEGGDDAAPEADAAPAVPGRRRHSSGVDFSRMRHDLYTPINHILGYCEMLQEEEGLPEEFHRDLERVHAGGRQLLALSRDYFDEETYRERRPEPHALHHELRTPVNHIVGYTELLEEAASDRGIDSVAADLKRIRDAAHRWLALIEGYLLAPAGAGGAVGAEAPRPDSVAAGTGDGGPAVPRPGADPPAPSPPPRGGGEAAAIAAGRVLVVDDDESNRDLLARRLRREGCEVEVVADGAEALESLRAGGFDLVLLDLVMPGLDGHEVLARIKADPALSELRVIMLSALDQEESIARCIEAGADDFISKPFNPVFLRARIGACLERKRARDREREFVHRIEEERARAEALLRNVLPASVAERLKGGESPIADQCAAATVLFADLVGFTPLARRLPPLELVGLLNAIFSRFDELASSAGLEKIKTIGDAYMVVAGAPEARADHAEAVADLALRMREAAAEVAARLGRDLDVRIGIHSGPLVAGIIGKSKFAYDLWGDTVNVASRMESSALPGTIQVSEATFRLVEPHFRFQRREPVEIKSLGTLATWLLVGR